MANYVQSIIVALILFIATYNIECVPPPQGRAIIHNKPSSSASFIQQESNLQDETGHNGLAPVQTSTPNEKTAIFVSSSIQPVISQTSSNKNGNNRAGTRDYVNPQAPLVGQTVRPQTSVTRLDHINLSTPSPHIVRSNAQNNNKNSARDYVNPNAALINPTANSKAGVSTQKPILPNSYAQAVNPSSLNTNIRDYVAPLRPPPSGIRIPNPSVAQPPPGSTTQISYANKAAAGGTTKSPLIIPRTPSTGPFNTGSSTTEKPEEGPTDTELREYSEALLKKDVNNAAKYVTINIQGKTTSSSKNDQAPQRLLDIKAEAYEIPTISKLKLLHNNYILDTSENEYVTPQEKTEENDLIDAMLSTPIMQYTKNFLISHNKITKDPKDFKDLLKTIWFSMYSRGGGRVGSSGFEHIFLAEKKNNEISGLHNWIYFDHAELNNIVDYLGYMKKIDLGEKGAILKFHFKLNGVDKPVDSMFIGTSPELEFALYSTCYLFRADRICPLKLNGHNFIVRAYKIRYRGKTLIGSAFPEI